VIPIRRRISLTIPEARRPHPLRPRIQTRHGRCPVKDLILSPTVGTGAIFPTCSGAITAVGVAFVAAVATDAAETGVADAADSITGSALVVAAASSGAAVGAVIAGAGVGVEASGVEATTGAVTTETSGVAAIA